MSQYRPDAHSAPTTADLIGLRVGDIITTDHDIRHPLEVTVEGVPKFKASPGAIKGQKAFQVTDRIEDKKPQSPDERVA